MLEFQLLQRQRQSSIPVPANLGSLQKGIDSWPTVSAKALEESHGTGGSMYDRHSKCTLIRDPTPLWCQAASYLAEMAAQVPQCYTK